MSDQEKYGNNFERAVIGKNDTIPPREQNRYKFAFENLYGSKVLDLGCSSGYSVRLLPPNISYTGIDCDEKIVKYAKENYPKYAFKQQKIEEILDGNGFWDTIVAFEVIEHLENGQKVAQELKSHCNRLFVSVPYKEALEYEWIEMEIEEDDIQDGDIIL